MKDVRGSYWCFRSADKVRSAAWSRGDSETFSGCCENSNNGDRNYLCNEKDK